MSSLAVGCGLDLDLEFAIWFVGLFSAPELAAAELLLQLSVLGEAEAKAEPTKSSTCSASSCCEGLSVEAEELTVEDIPASASTELDRRARKRYRLLPELYANTSPAKSDAAAKKKRRKTHYDHGGSSSESKETRRARKRYRLLPELYANTSPAKSDAAAKKKRRKTHYDHGGSSSESKETRYGGDY